MTRIPAAICLVLLAATAFAAEQKERSRPDVAFNRDTTAQREVAPLLFALPELNTNDTSILELRVFQVKHQLIRQTVALPAHVPAGAAVDVLFTHPDELTRLRTIESETPGLRFIALLDGRVIADEPFASIEKRGKTLSLDAAIGQVQEVEVRAVKKPLVKAETIIKDPECMSWCDQQLAQCLDWCDPRGSDCNLCYTWYHDCSVPCPDVCVEPKSTSTYNNVTLVSATPFGNGCYRGEVWTHWSNHYLVSVYQRTTHCDNSYTDTFQYSYYQDTDCWINTHSFCTGGYAFLPPNQC
ncbi:MAG TPA: hypothetical protein VJ276_12480 [Thermoanaerobaculia bacterium]|nr:hypothetical protein [Thermoanaerobaculia bacterium]